MKKKVRKDTMFWNSFANRYDNFISRHAQKVYRQITHEVRSDLISGVSVLEIGTGTGSISCTIAKYVKEIHAIDFAPEMIKLAKEKQKQQNLNNIVFQVGDATSLKFDDNSMDIIIAVNVIHLIGDPELAMREICRVIKNGGMLIVPTYCHGDSLKSIIISKLMGLCGFKTQSRWSTDSFRTFVQNAGFEIKKELLIPDRIPLNYLVGMKHKIRSDE